MAVCSHPSSSRLLSRTEYPLPAHPSCIHLSLTRTSTGINSRTTVSRTPGAQTATVTQSILTGGSNSSTALFLLLLSLAFTSLVGVVNAQALPTTIARRGHTGTLIKDTVHFVGGLGTSATGDNTPLNTISSLNLKELVFTETPTTLGVYNHAATANQTVSYSLKDSRIAISFGQTGANAPASALQWLDPATGNITAGESAVSSKELAGRMGHNLVQVGNNLWSFGGRPLPATGGASATVPVIADTPTYDLSSKAWSNLTKGLARYGHASARVGRDKVVSCFGVDTGKRQGAECVYFSVSTAKYEDVKLIWANPDDKFKGSRIGHTLVTGLPDANTLYLFGGQNPAGTTFFQDFYRLDASKLPDITITKIDSTETTLIPSPRSSHAALTVGSHQGFMVIHGGIGSNNSMADAAPYFFDMTSGSWIDGAAFQAEYADQKAATVSSVSIWVIIVPIMAGVMVLGACVALYIWKGLRDDERKRKEEEEAAKQQAGSPTLSTMENSFDDGRQGGGERKSHQVYNLGSGEDHSMSMGPFKSTSSLIQPDGDEGKGSRKNQQRSSESYNASPTTYRSRNNEPYSPGGTTLAENSSVNGYFSSSSSRLNKNNSNASSHHSRQGTATTAGSVTRPAAAATSGRGVPGRDSYYNNRDLYIDDHEDDASSVTVSVTSDGSNLSPWAGPVRLDNDFAPPNPRFSRGAISHAHRQLVGSIITNNAGGVAAGGNRSSSGWDTSSPGGSLSSRDDSEHQRRSVNSMQWVSFEPLELSIRPESGVFDPLSQRSNLTVRNASMYSNFGNGPRTSMLGRTGANMTIPEDSKS